jgi:NADPH2:quinone reductase
MRAWLLPAQTGIQSLYLGTVPDPEPAAGEVVLRVSYAALNPADYYLAEGHYPAKPAFPHILGRDGMGAVTAIGPGVSGTAIGDQRTILRSEVGVNRPGTFAELVAVPVESLILPPAGWTDQQSAAAPLVYLTAWQALTQWGSLPPSVVLISGASGGVGVATTQLAAAMGHTVVVLSRDAGKREQLKHIGAAYGFDPTDSNWSKALKAALGSRRVDLAVDNIGGTLLPEMIETLGNHGRVSCVGMLAGPVPQFNTATLFFRRLRLGGVAVGAYTPAESQQAWAQLLEVLRQAGARPLIDHVFAFEELPKAFERLKKGPMGKVLIKVAG